MRYFDDMGRDVTEEILELRRRVETLERMIRLLTKDRVAEEPSFEIIEEVKPVVNDKRQEQPDNPEQGP